MTKRSTRDMTPEQREREREYQRRYWLKNRKRLSESRRAQRQNTPGVMAAYRRRSRQRHLTHDRPKTLERRAKQLATTMRLDDLAPRGLARVVATGEEHCFYSLSHLSQLLGRATDTLLDWESRGVLPRPRWIQKELDRVLIKGGNPRLYSRDEMEVYAGCRHLLIVATRLEESAFRERLWAEMALLTSTCR